MDNDLIWAIKKTLLEQLNEDSIFMESDIYEVRKQWIISEATNDQLCGLLLELKDTGTSSTVATTTKQVIKDVSKKAADAIKTTGKQTIKNAGEKVVKQTRKAITGDPNVKSLANYHNLMYNVAKYAAYGGLAIAGVAVLGVTLNYLYKKYFSKAAKFCQDKEGDDFKYCIKLYKRDAILKVINRLESEKRVCVKTADPKACNEKLDRQLLRWRQKLSTYMS